ncbi:MAG: hypothetical protein JWR05_3065 [Mucilaginibacter sp.]|nr:hypothetical protein [Mucilaginibacter sp.]
MYLYIMPLHKTNIYFNVQQNRWWLALTLFLSFFALSGYVNNVQQSRSTALTEQVVLPNESLKKAISFKKAQSLFYNKCYTNPLFKSDDNTAVFLYNNVVNTQYLHLKQLALLNPRLIIPLNILLHFSASKHPAASRS